MKKIFAFCAATYLLLLVGCGSSEVSAGTTGQSNSSNSAVENTASPPASTENTSSQVNAAQESAHKTKNLLIKQTFYNDPGGIYWVEYEYDNAGRTTKDSTWRGDTLGFYRINEYDTDASGNVLEKRQYDDNGQLIEKIIYEYDKAGLRTRREYYLGDMSTPSEVAEYEYNAEGLCCKTTKYDYSDNPTGWTSYEYDGTGNKILEEHYDSNGNLGKYKEFEYNDAGTCIKEVSYNSDGSLGDRIERIVDDNGREISEVFFNPYGTARVASETEYNESGSRSCITNYYTDGSIYSIDEYADFVVN